MPTSIGHALAGAAAAWSVDLVPGRRAWRTAPPTASWYRRAGNGLTLVCAALAAVPDADLLFRLHRTFSHSIGAVVLVGILAAAIGVLTNRPAVSDTVVTFSVTAAAIMNTMTAAKMECVAAR